MARDYTERHPDNLMGHLIVLGQCRDAYQIGDCIARLQQQLAEPHYKQIRQTFSIWISRLLRTRFRNDAIPEQHDLEEVNTMLAENLEQWVQGFEDRGERQLLLKLMKLKFGSVPDWAQAKLDQASSGQMDVWGERILTADSLDALLAD
ncbi:hypothetical protein L1889_17340 [Paenalcaligenes niemegkensis]|uniref:hypothetical protein n=1 Tax=Paenalcaligenes niemegkensis TaxID=2895469 RepID=UPI001EE885D4|nr:hypothetical protein [Paenalcaligenes niemegkensis]MCQ9618220.1 hypothetical protein [Paenalcaligenes niemegkensis]